MFNKPCKVCSEKESRINDLKDQVTFLQHLLSPRANLTNVEVEANAIIDLQASSAPITTVDPEIQALDEEAIRLLTGTYDDGF